MNESVYYKTITCHYWQETKDLATDGATGVELKNDYLLLPPKLVVSVIFQVAWVFFCQFILSCYKEDQETGRVFLNTLSMTTAGLKSTVLLVRFRTTERLSGIQWQETLRELQGLWPACSQILMFLLLSEPVNRMFLVEFFMKFLGHECHIILEVLICWLLCRTRMNPWMSMDGKNWDTILPLDAVSQSNRSSCPIWGLREGLEASDWSDHGTQRWMKKYLTGHIQGNSCIIFIHIHIHKHKKWVKGRNEELILH